MTRFLTTSEAKTFYDRLGRGQDAQGWYEDHATKRLVAHAALGDARSVFELGCGTGRFAERLLREILPTGARYTGIDVSETMLGIARPRLARFGSRVTIRQTDGKLPLPDGNDAYDRFLSTYVLDLLAPEAIEQLVAEAHRVLVPGGLFAVTGLTHPEGPISRVVMGAWSLLWRASPKLVGGCRPLVVRDYLDDAEWDVRHHETITAYGIPSEALVAVAK